MSISTVHKYQYTVKYPFRALEQYHTIGHLDNGWEAYTVNSVISPTEFTSSIGTAIHPHEWAGEKDNWAGKTVEHGGTLTGINSAWYDNEVGILTLTTIDPLSLGVGDTLGLRGLGWECDFGVELFPRMGEELETNLSHVFPGDDISGEPQLCQDFATTFWNAGIIAAFNAATKTDRVEITARSWTYPMKHVSPAEPISMCVSIYTLKESRVKEIVLPAAAVTPAMAAEGFVGGESSILSLGSTLYWPGDDVSGASAELQALATQVWTTQMIADYAYLKAHAFPFEEAKSDMDGGVMWGLEGSTWD